MTDRLFEDPDTLLGQISEADVRAAALAEAREELRRRLPDLRKLPGFPQGSDEDILAMSYPPYYTACPNPFIGEWLKRLERPADEGRVDPGPFAADVSEGKTNPYYKAHAYATKVPHPAIMRLILHYTQPGDVVLDGFSGSGMTGVAALACGRPDSKMRADIEQEMGKVAWGARRAILNDLGPSATMIAAGVTLPISGTSFDRASSAMLDRFDREYGWIYKTTVIDEMGRTNQADIDYTIWSQVFTCPHCGGEVVFYEAALDTTTGAIRESFPCGSCGAALEKKRLERRFATRRTLAGDEARHVEFRPAQVFWRIGKRRGSKAADADDRALLDRVAAEVPRWFPQETLPLSAMVHGSRLGPKGFTRSHHLWPDRSLLALSVLWGWADEEKEPLLRLALRFWIEQAFWGLSWMNRYNPTDFSQVNRHMKGVYYVGSLMSECSVRYNLQGSMPARGKRTSLAKLWAHHGSPEPEVMISTGSSTSLPIDNEVVDYVFVDPPFGQNIPYSDLALVNEYWLRVLTSMADEATQDSYKGRSLDDYSNLITQCFCEFFRVLKPGRWMTIEFSNHSNDVWLRIQNALAYAGFVVADTRVIDKEQLSHRQVTASNAVKHDLMISAYKPAAATEESFEIAAGSADGAWAFVREHLSRIPATEGVKGKALVVRERQADRIYERMVGYHVARNTLVPMTAAEFYAGLEQRFPVRDGMYFLSAQVEEYERFRITFRDLATQELFIRDESTAVQWLRQTLKDRPRSFADVQPIFMKEMQAGIASWEAMPDLKTMLEDNFVLDDKGRWCVPDPKKLEHLDQLRTRALLKEYEVYTSGRGPLARFRAEAVRAGFKAAWAAKDFSAIVAVGKRLPSDVFIEDSALLHYFRNAERLAQ